MEVRKGIISLLSLTSTTIAFLPNLVSETLVSTTTSTVGVNKISKTEGKLEYKDVFSKFKINFVRSLITLEGVEAVGFKDEGVPKVVKLPPSVYSIEFCTQFKKIKENYSYLKDYLYCW